MRDYKIIIFNKEKGMNYIPIIEGEITLSWSRQFEAGSLTFNVVKDGIIDYQEGNSVSLLCDGKLLFYGYVWSKERNKKQIIHTVCYDQLIYFKYKDTYQYENKSYSEFLKMLCADRKLQIGEIEDTLYKIPLRVERDKEFFSMVKTASELTTSHTGTEYVLFDDKGKIFLKKWESLKVLEPITYNTAQDFSYKTTLEGVYNTVKVNYIDDDKKSVKPYIFDDKKNVNNWGVLQYYIETNNKENIPEKAKTLLDLLNKKNRSLSIRGAFGNWDVRGGSLVPVVFENIGDISIKSMMLVDKVTHRVKNGHHFMDLTVFNKDINSLNQGKGIFTNKPNKSSDNSKGSKSFDSEKTNYKRASSDKLNNMINYALSQKGTPYSQPKRMQEGYFDCSSLVLRSMRKAGLDQTGAGLTSRSISSDKRFVPVSLKEIKAGDVLWCKGHVAFYIGNNKTIEATKSGVKSIVVNGRNTPFTKAYRIKE